MNQKTKLDVMVEFATNLAQLSYCKRAKVGCIIVPKDYTQVLSIGYNGPPSGVSNNACTNEPGKCGCIHAEMNALIKLKTCSTDLILITTTSPCVLCAGLIINSKQIGTVFYCEDYRDTRPIDMLKEACLNVALYERWRAS